VSVTGSNRTITQLKKTIIKIENYEEKIQRHTPSCVSQQARSCMTSQTGIGSDGETENSLKPYLKIAPPSATCWIFKNEKQIPIEGKLTLCTAADALFNFRIIALVRTVFGGAWEPRFSFPFKDILENPQFLGWRSLLEKKSHFTINFSGHKRAKMTFPETKSDQKKTKSIRG
jgi:hypothetical protein